MTKSLWTKCLRSPWTSSWPSSQLCLLLLALVLAFIGAKMMAEPWWDMPVLVSLGGVAGILLVTILLSVLAGPKTHTEPGHANTGNQGIARTD